MTKKEFKTLKVGDKVQLINKRGEYWNWDGLMDEYIGQVVTINYLGDDWFWIDELGENCRRWVFKYKDIAQKVDDYLKVECTDVCWICGDDKYFTKGKTYERINGVMKCDNGFEHTLRCKEDNPSEWDFCLDTVFEVVARYKSDDAKKLTYDDYMKVRCVKVRKADEPLFTKGKTYERINGGMIDDGGFKFKSLCKSDDVSKWEFSGLDGTTEFELVEHYKNGVDVMKKDKEVDIKCDFSGSYFADAIAALTRLGEDLKKLSDEPTVCPVCGADLNKVKEVKRPAKVGEWIKIVNPLLDGGLYKQGDILKVASVSTSVWCGATVSVDGISRNILESEYIVLEGYERDKEVSVNPVKAEFKPHMVNRFSNCHYGVLGTKTKYKDAVGRELFVGDVVELYDDKGNKVGLYSVVEDDEDGQFIMSIALDCDSKTGTIKNGWKILKVRGYEDIKNNEIIGDSIGCIKYITEESKKEEFKPHMVLNDEYTNNYGTIGVKTKFKDVLGRELYTGDVVDIYRNGKLLDYGGTAAIVETKRVGQFVMGIQFMCNGDTGEIKDYKVLKVRGYEDVKDDEYVDAIHYIKTERK